MTKAKSVSHLLHEASQEITVLNTWKDDHLPCANISIKKDGKETVFSLWWTDQGVLDAIKQGGHGLKKLIELVVNKDKGWFTSKDTENVRNTDFGWISSLKR